MKKLFALLLLFAFPAAAVFPTICVNCWYQVPNSRLDSSAALPGTIPAPGGTAYQTIFTAWGGGTFDQDSNRLILWGGGHSDYSGNEIYSWSIDSAKWFRIRDPATNVTFTAGSAYYNSTTPDSAQPRSRHTYATLSTCPGTNKMIAVGSIAEYSDADGNDGILRYSFTSQTWKRLQRYPIDVPNGNSSPNLTFPWSAYDSVTGRIFFHGNSDQHAWLTSLRCSDDSVGSHGGYWTDDMSAKLFNAAVDVKGRRVWAFGQDTGLYWDITTPGTGSTHNYIPSRGPRNIRTATGPGLDYSYVDTTIVGWANGDSVFTFRKSDSTWVAVPPSGSNTIHPSTSQANGTYGRWRYVKNHNFFVVVNSAQTSVYYYRLSADNTASTSTGGRKALLGVGN